MRRRGTKLRALILDDGEVIKAILETEGCGLWVCGRGSLCKWVSDIEFEFLVDFDGLVLVRVVACSIAKLLNL